MKKRKMLSVGSLALVGSLLFSGVALADFSDWPTLRQGSSGGYVTGLQANLYSYGQQSAVGTIDGSFGSGTRTGLINMQRATGLSADGVAGSSTWSEMDDASIFDTPYTWTLHTPYSTTYMTSYRESGGRLAYALQYKSDASTVKSGYIY
ncbi:peptidoglycan-binding protein [Paenibacillus terreus]|uniref:Peptidoglycan-binding protein n=1 Tax=Paenibacillus terreus TaxID=1387834 RepID=A0ABV5BC00_9BACL